MKLKLITTFIRPVILFMLIAYSTINYGQGVCPFNGPDSMLINTSPVLYSSGQWFRFNNTWDWTHEFLASYNATDYINHTMAYCESGSSYSGCPFCQCGLHNPYYSVGEPAVKQIVGTDYANLNGWELVKRDFGYLNSGDVNLNASTTPYFILYNRFSGKLRVLAAASQQVGIHQIMDIKLSFIKPGDWPDLSIGTYHTSALFAHYGSYSATLADSGSSLTFTTPAIYSDDEMEFFYGDFQMAYDPCSCLFQSGIEVAFTLVDSMNVNLQGNILGTSVPLTSSDRKVLDPTHQWLSSVGSDGFSVNGGLQMYRDLDSLTANYTNKLNAYNNAQQIHSIFTTITSLAGGLGSILTAFPGIYHTLGLGNVDSSSKKILSGISDASKAVGVGSSFFSSVLFGGGSAPVQPTVLYAQAELTGTISEEIPNNAYDILIGNPGSLGSDSLPEVGTSTNHLPSYPQYNEILGVFALLHPPYVTRYHWSSEIDVTQAESTGGDESTTEYIGPTALYYNYRAYKLSSPSDIQYVINPATRPNLNLTVIQAAWEDVWTDSNYFSNLAVYDGSEPTSNLEAFGLATNLLPFVYGSSSIDYISQFFDLAHFQNLYISPPPAITGNVSSGSAIDYSSDSLFIKFNIVLVSHDTGTNGAPNGAMFTIRYYIPPDHITDEDITAPTYVVADTEISAWGASPIVPIITSSPNFPSDIVVVPFPSQNDTINSSTVMTAGISADNVYISAPVTTTSSTPITIMAINSITIGDGGSVGPNINLVIDPNGGVPEGSAIPPISSGTLSTFCSSSSYKGYTPVQKTNYTPSSNTTNTITPPSNFNINLYPNPANGECTVRFTESAGANVTITVADITGREVATIDNSWHNQGTSFVPFNTQSYAPGVYLVRFSDGTNTSTQRLTITQKN